MLSYLLRPLTGGVALLAAVIVSTSVASAHNIANRVTIAKPSHTVVRVHDDGRRWGYGRYYRNYDRGTVVDAPTTYVDTRGYRRVWVDAPFTAVRVHPRGVWVRAPFVDLYIPR